MAPSLRHGFARSWDTVKRSTIGILAGVMGSALALWWTRRHRSPQQTYDYAAMAEGII
jgi:hypothetical protein